MKNVYIIYNPPVAANNDTKAVDNHDFIQPTNVIGVSVCSDFETTITLAVDQIGDALPPNHTPNARAHRNNSTHGSFASNCK